MSQQEAVIFAYSAMLIVATIALAGLYHRKLIPLTREYLQAKSILNGIVTTFRRRYDELSQTNLMLVAKIDAVTKELKEVPVSLFKLSEHLESLTVDVENLAKQNEGLKAEMVSLRSEFTAIREETRRNETPAALSYDRTTSTDTTSPKREADTHTRLTETEQFVLHFLETEGPKTSRQIEAKINKTREHTARLMKKLWEQGYVERETHRTPFTYRLANRLRQIEAKRS